MEWYWWYLIIGGAISLIIFFYIWPSSIEEFSFKGIIASLVSVLELKFTIALLIIALFWPILILLIIIIYLHDY